MTGLTPFNPDSWMDVVVLIVLGILGLSATVVPLWLKAKSTQSQVAEIHEQTVNDHGDEVNLRVQLDRMEQSQLLLDERMVSMASQQDEAAADIRGFRKDFGELRGEMREDRGNLRDLERRVTGFARRVHPDQIPP
ncbi:DUF2746 domain-containing protein [Mycolicibacterium fluoranthenivorans]|nr:DUF2746 domain-containing protein [Mycolicibacterium fluoranthenivorans]